MWKKLFIRFTCSIMLLIIPSGYLLAGKVKESPLPGDVVQDLAYVLKFIKPQFEPPVFKPDRISHLLDFVAEPYTTAERHHADNLFGSPSAYYGVTINRRLAHILRYAYNSGIPYCTIAPSTVRMCQLKQTDRGQPSWPRLWEMLSDLDQPITVKGVEYVVNTPELFTGAYYAYDQDRVLILFKYHGKNAMVSISKQRGKSEVGKKGLVLGNDQNWDYIYTGEPGLTKSGLGWIRSYMYDSIGVTIYYEVEPEKPLVRLGIFRWVRAGWAKLNMVNRNHIFTGIQRFAVAFKHIIEYPQLPADDELVELYSQIERISMDGLRQHIKGYLARLKDKHQDSKEFPKKWRKFILEDSDYVNRLTKEEMKSILFVERLKAVLGQP